MQKIMKYKNILETIGNTPIVELKSFSLNPKVKIFAKLEGNNPSGSIKDRVALYMINDALRSGLLKNNQELIEATSGNTGIAMAMVAGIFGIKFTAVMSENVSLERKKLLSAYGANIILTDGEKGTNNAIDVAKRIVNENNGKYLMLDQFSNPANVLAHYETTGKEIIRDIPEITHFVAGMGTGGTLMGVRKRLKEFNKNIRIIGVEPKAFSKIQGLRNMKAYTPPIFDETKLDLKLFIDNDDIAFKLAKELFTKEGISVGISSGAALWGAMEIAKTIKSGTIVIIFPDKGDKYLSVGSFGKFRIKW